ncbi:MAG: hypothetical protein EOO10_26030, partial [Chitinophagaceae bacterium]
MMQNRGPIRSRMFNEGRFALPRLCSLKGYWKPLTANRKSKTMRALWKGSIGFGLVNIPVGLYSATEESNLTFVSLDKASKGRIRYKKVSEATGKEVKAGDIVKAYDLGGDFVTVSEEDFEKAIPTKKDHIEIVQFVDEKQIDALYYEKPYYL